MTPGPTRDWSQPSAQPQAWNQRIPIPFMEIENGGGAALEEEERMSSLWCGLEMSVEHLSKNVQFAGEKKVGGRCQISEKGLDG